MSSSEKRLLTVFGVAIFIVVNLYAITTVRGAFRKQERARDSATQELQVSELAAEKRSEVEPQIKWLEDNKKNLEPKADQIAQAELQTFAHDKAIERELQIKSGQGEVILPVETTSPLYHRARLQFQVTGSEEALYRWIDQLQSPKEFRAVTSLHLAPNKEDDTKIDAKLIVEQWFVPST